MGKKLPRAGDRKSWKGGYARYSERAGGFVYFLYAKGRIEKSTGIVDNEGLALLHFDAWQANPGGYDPRDVRASDAPLLFDKPLVDLYCQHLGGRKKNPASPHHVARSRTLLGWWLGLIGGRNLRALELSDLTKACPDDGTVSAFRMKRVTIKAIVNWLHEEGALKRAEGPDVDRLEAPQSRGLNMHGQNVDPAALAEREHKGANAATAYLLVREELPAHWRNVLDLLAATGWHVKEVQRWVHFGYLEEPMPKGRETEGAGYLVTVHKSGAAHRTIVSAVALKAAREFKVWNEGKRGQAIEVPQKVRNAEGNVVGFEMVPSKRSEFPYQYFLKVVRKAVHRINREFAKGKRAERCPPKFGPGHLRHGVATHAARGGLDATRSFLGHAEGSKMLETHYVDPQAQAHARKGAAVIHLPRKVATLL